MLKTSRRLKRFRRRREFRLREGRVRNLGIEPLESRLLLDAEGIAWAAPDLTISFAPDGTNVAGYESSLFAELNSLGASDSWRDAVVRGFQTWAQHTTATVTTADDSGDPFGVPGPTQGDARFGDVRIGAIPMAADVFAISIPHDEVISGTWAGDVLFNSNAEFSSLDEIFAVAVHEAGHVFGLGHSTDPASPMFLHGITSVVTPTAEDIAALQSLYGGFPGAKSLESEHEREHENDELVTANDVALSAKFQGAIRYDAAGQIFDATDIDYYRLTPIDNQFEAADVLTVTVRATTPLGLAPRATIFSHEGQTLEANILANADGQLVLQAKGADPRHTKFVKVEAADATGPHSIGGYDVVATYGTREVKLSKITNGTLKSEESARTSVLHVSETRLVHFVLAAKPIESDSAIATWAAIYDETGNPVYRVAARPGESRSANTVLLTPGDYRIEFHGGTSDGPMLAEIDYELLAESLSLPVGPQPVDPTEMPILPCSDPVSDPAYCYPVNLTDPVVLPDPYPYPLPEPVVIVTPPWIDPGLWYWDGIAPPNNLPAPLGTGAPPTGIGTNPGIPGTQPLMPATGSVGTSSPNSDQPNAAGTSTGASNGQTTQPPVGSTAAVWQNPSNSNDVNTDNFVTPLDVLLVVNYLNSGQTTVLSGEHPPGVPYIDVNADGIASPFDALIVINGINAGSIAAAEGEATRVPAPEPIPVLAASLAPSPSVIFAGGAPVPSVSTAVTSLAKTATVAPTFASSTADTIFPPRSNRSLVSATTRRPDERFAALYSLDEVLGAIAGDVGQVWNGL